MAAETADSSPSARANKEDQKTAESADNAPQPIPSSNKRRRSASVSSSDGRRRSASRSGSDSVGPDANAEEVSATAEQNDPPLPNEAPPPLPNEAPPEDDGWEPQWDINAQAYYFFNRFTGISQWENPRVPDASAAGLGTSDRITSSGAPGTTTSSGAPDLLSSSPPRRRYGGYNPAVHGDYDPNADYAIEAQREAEEEEAAAAAATAFPMDQYGVRAHFNRFTGRFQNSSINPENHNDENKSRRQMSAFFDVDAAANSHDGRSLKAERQNKKLSKKEVQAFQAKRREKKEEKRRAWLRD